MAESGNCKQIEEHEYIYVFLFWPCTELNHLSIMGNHSERTQCKKVSVDHLLRIAESNMLKSVSFDCVPPSHRPPKEEGVSIRKSKKVKLIL